MLWLRRAIKGPGCQEKNIWFKPHFSGTRLTKFRGCEASLLDDCFHWFSWVLLPGCVLKHMLHTSAQVITVDGSPVLPMPWSGDVQQKGSSGRMGKAITAGEHLHPNSYTSSKWWPATHLQRSNLSNHEFGRGATTCFMKKKKGLFSCSMLSPHITDQFWPYRTHGSINKCNQGGL